MDEEKIILNFIVKDRIIKFDKSSLTEKVVGDNTGYVANFIFDEEWTNKVKTARFIKNSTYVDMILDDNDQCDIPLEVLKSGTLEVGVFAGNLRSSTSCKVSIKSSILESNGLPAAPTDDVYAQIIEKVEAIESVKKAVINDDGILVITLTSGLELNVGQARGVGIKSFEQTAVSTEDSGENEFLVTLTDDTEFSFKIQNGSKGSKGDKGETGATPKLSIGTVETLSPNEESKATISGTAEEPVLNLSLVKGDTGATPDISIGTVETVKPNESAEATMTGTAENPVLNLKVPQGETGLTPNLSIGTVSTVSPTESASATMTGTKEEPVLNLSIPKGDSGTSEEEIAEAVMKFSDDVAEAAPDEAAIAHQIAYTLKGFRNPAKYISYTQKDAHDNIVLADDAVLPPKMYIRSTSSRPILNATGFNKRQGVKEIAFARDFKCDNSIDKLPVLSDCTDLEKIYLPDNITFLPNLSRTAFKIADFENVTQIGGFCGCTQLESVNLPNLTSISSTVYRHGFDGCSNLKEINIPSVTSLGTYAFRHCANLELAELPSGITHIGNYAFQWCAKLTLTKLPEGLEDVMAYAFSNCTNLALTQLPGGITFIGDYAFANCGKITLTEIPVGVTKIGGCAFVSCVSLTSITFLGTPESIAANAFQRCTNLTTFNVPWSEGEVANAPWGAVNATINYNYNETGI